MQIGEVGRALSDYAEVIQRKDGAAGYYQRGRAYVRLQENELALADFNKGIEIEPKFAEAYLSRGETYERLDRQQDAKSDYLRVVELASAEIQMWEKDYPILGPVYYRRGVAHQRLGDIEQALADFKMVAKLSTGGEIGREAETRLRMLVPHH